MALALILALDTEPEGVRVRYDIGKNVYVRWLLGDEETVTRNGLPSLANVQHRSPLLEPLPAEARGRGEFVIPNDQISAEGCWLQLLSYRTREGAGPAVSAITRVPYVGRRASDDDRFNDISRSDLAPDLPAPVGMAFRTTGMEGRSPSSPQFEKDRIMTRVASAFSQQVDSVPFALRERSMSNAMFTGAEIIGVVGALAPLLAPAVGLLASGVAPVIGQVANQFIRTISGGAGGGSSGGGTSAGIGGVVRDGLANLADQGIRSAGTASQQLLTPENIRQIMGVINAAQNGTLGAAPVAAAPVAAAPVAVASSLYRRLGARPYARAASTTTGYSQAQVAPALLAALPALMPLLQQVLSPQTVQSIVQAPERMTGQIINGITDFARLGLQADQQLNDHLRQLNPGVDDPALHQLLAGMSMGLSASRNRNYKRVTSVRVQMDEVPMQVVFGRTMALYQQGVTWQFPASVETPQSISNVDVLLQLKQADNLRVVHEDSETLESIASGPLEVIPSIDASITQKLIPNKDYIVVLSLIWRNSKGQLRGTSMQQTLSVMGQYRFDRVEEAGELIPLNDREMFRDYWHQMWTYTFDDETRRVDLHTRYYLTLSPERNRNARVDTDVRRDGEGARQTLKLRSGYEYSVFALNHLLSRLAPDQKPLDETLLSAIASSDFVERFNQAAQHQGQIRGRPGENASLWVFPVMKLQTLLLVKAEQVDDNGVIGSLGEEQVVFPMPVMMHFVGVKQS